ncbi:uncharacterized protein METZ01_LOCUS4633 [marine metagenome]|uniref:Uncharacterized protein n=1 Tax=marine metagenome TaxID=408172 RepID=A0A381NBG5_9ZZZZ
MGPDHRVERLGIGGALVDGTPVGVAPPVDVLRAVAGRQAAQALPQFRWEGGVGGLHVGEEGVPAAPRGQHVDLEHGGRRWLLVTGDVGVPAVAVGDGGVAVRPDEEHGRVLVFGGGRRMLVEWPEA